VTTPKQSFDENELEFRKEELLKDAPVDFSTKELDGMDESEINYYYHKLATIEDIMLHTSQYSKKELWNQTDEEIDAIEKEVTDDF